MIVNLHFERGKANATQNQDDAKAGEGEDEDQQPSRKQRRANKRQANIAPDRPFIGAQKAGGLFRLKTERRPIAGDDAERNGEVVKHMDDNNDSQRSLKLNRRIIEGKKRRQQVIEQAAPPQQRHKSQGDHHGWQHKRQDRQ